MTERRASADEVGRLELLVLGHVGLAGLFEALRTELRWETPRHDVAGLGRRVEQEAARPHVLPEVGPEVRHADAHP